MKLSIFQLILLAYSFECLLAAKEPSKKRSFLWKIQSKRALNEENEEDQKVDRLSKLHKDIVEKIGSHADINSVHKLSHTNKAMRGMLAANREIVYCGASLYAQIYDSGYQIFSDQQDEFKPLEFSFQSSSRCIRHVTLLPLIKDLFIKNVRVFTIVVPKLEETKEAKEAYFKALRIMFKESHFDSVTIQRDSQSRNPITTDLDTERQLFAILKSTKINALHIKIKIMNLDAFKTFTEVTTVKALELLDPTSDQEEYVVAMKGRLESYVVTRMTIPSSDTLQKLQCKELSLSYIDENYDYRYEKNLIMKTEHVHSLNIEMYGKGVNPLHALLESFLNTKAKFTNLSFKDITSDHELGLILNKFIDSLTSVAIQVTSDMPEQINVFLRDSKLLTTLTIASPFFPFSFLSIVRDGIVSLSLRGSYDTVPATMDNIVHFIERQTSLKSLSINMASFSQPFSLINIGRILKAIIKRKTLKILNLNTNYVRTQLLEFSKEMVNQFELVKEMKLTVNGVPVKKMLRDIAGNVVPAGLGCYTNKRRR